MADLQYWHSTIVPDTSIEYRIPGLLDQLTHNSRLQVDAPTSIVKHTNIVATLGTSTFDQNIIQEMIAEGMTIVRLESVLNDQATHDRCITMVRQAAYKYGQKMGQNYPVALALDTRGPEIRTGLLEAGPLSNVSLRAGETIKLTTDKAYMFKGNATTMYVDYDNIQKVVQPGSRIFVGDGMIMLQCTGITGSTMVCTIIVGGTLAGFACVNLPGLPVDLPNLSDQDKSDLLFAVDRGLDIIFASFVRNVDCIHEIRQILGEKGKHIPVIAKLENQQGIENMEEIMKAADGAMVARGDLGIELPMEKLLAVQRKMIGLGRKYFKPIITAREILGSMKTRLLPTSGEVCDLANAILEGIDCVMLSAETSKGLYPVETVRYMARVCKEAENAIYHDMIFNDLVIEQQPPMDIVRALALTACESASKSSAAAIIVITTTGISAFLVAKYYPRCPVVAITTTPQVARQARLYRGVYPLIYSETRLATWPEEMEARVAFGITYGKAIGFIKSGDPVVVITPWKETKSGLVNTMRIMYVTDIVEPVMY